MLTNAAVYRKALQDVVKVQQQFTELPIAPSVTNDHSVETAAAVDLPVMNLLNHGHFINYGGGYYSYLFARMYAAQIWHKHFAQDPLNR